MSRLTLIVTLIAVSILTSAFLLTTLRLSDKGRDPAVKQYKVQIRYTKSATQNDFNEAIDTLHRYDQDPQIQRQGIFPVIDVAYMSPDTPSFCPTIEELLEKKTYVQRVTCQKWDEPSPVENPDEPVEPKMNYYIILSMINKHLGDVDRAKAWKTSSSRSKEIA